MKRIVIVGAGISGLALAYRLQQLLPAADLTVLEENSRVGGTVWTERQDGFLVEFGPNGFTGSKPSTINLCQGAGLGGQLEGASEAARRNRYIFVGGRLQRLPHNFKSFLSTSLLSWRGKLSILAERFRRPGAPEDESVDAFVRRRLGREAAEIFADALVTGIHGGDPTLLSLRASFPRLAEMEQKHGSLIKGMARADRAARREARSLGETRMRGDRMWSFTGGLRVLVEALAGQLRNRPLLGVKASQIEKSTAQNTGAAWTLRGDGMSWHADALILTCPAHRQAELLEGVDSALAAQVGGVRYNGVAVVALGYRRADVPGGLDGFGYIAPQATRRDLLGVQWCSTIFPQRAPPGYVLLRALAGGWNRPDILSWPDGRLIDAILVELRLAMKIETPPIFHRVIRWEKAIPQYHLGHAARVNCIEHRLAAEPGLFLGGSAFHGIALNDCTEQAQSLARRVATFLQAPAECATP
jgi:oxygen-dependent protoporphyrinogen oxidase